MGSLGNFIGTIKFSELAEGAPNAHVGLNALATFTPTGSLNPNNPQPAISGSFTFLSPSMVAAVPEPASWAMLLIGFGMTGAVLRRRKAALAA
jgi:hypothetical protein